MSDGKSGLKDKLVFFGPGLLLAITAAGEFGIIEATEIGSEFGLSLIWVVVLALIFKYAFTTGIARYTLSTGKSFFEGLADLPGPAHWGQYLIILSYVVEAISLGAMVMFAATYLEYLIPGTYSITVLSFLIIFLAVLIIRMKLYSSFEKIMAAIVVGMTILVMILQIDFPLGINAVIGGISPKIPADSETSILCIIGMCGSGLNIMLYSYWMKKRMVQIGFSGAADRTTFRKYMKSVKADIAIGFIIVTIVTIGFMALGKAGSMVSMTDVGTELSLDRLISQTLSLVNSIPYMIYPVVVMIIVIFFGSVVVGMESKTEVITETVCSIRNTDEARKPAIRFTVILLYALLMMATTFAGEPLHIMAAISSLCAILFGAFGIILIYMNHKLPRERRGHTGWSVFVGLGSVFSIYVALLIEQSFIEYGVTLIEKMLVAAVLIYLFLRLGLAKRLMKGEGMLSDAFWTVLLCGAMSIYGTTGGIEIGIDEISFIVNFRDLGPMIAGILGGPWTGLGAALIGGGYRLSMGGDTALPCFLGTIAAGLIAGFLIRYWQGEFDIKKALKLSVGVELLHILVLLPLCVFITGSMDMEYALEVMAITLLPMVTVNAIGMMIFSHFVRRYDRMKGAMKNGFSMKLKNPFDEWSDEDG